MLKEGISNKMNELEAEELRYPIGKFEHSGEIGAGERKLWIQTLRSLPAELRTVVEDLSDS